MKILITGMNKNQVTKDFYLRQQLKVVPSHYSLIKCLEDMGHEVEQRNVTLGEDLYKYEKVIVFLASPRQLTVGNFYHGLWSIYNRPDCILAFDDWQINDIFKGLENISDTLFNDFTMNNFLSFNKKYTDGKIRKYKEIFLEALDIIKSKKNRILISAFKGGDLSKLINYPKELLYTYNPNPYHLNKIANNIEPENKIKSFNFASLVQSKTKKWLKKQNITKWTIEYFGSRKDKQRRLVEEDMCNVFGEQWACLMPGYDNSGSGWWRARPLQVADANSILIGEPSELMLYYNDEKLSNIKACDVENMTIDELKETAKLQKEAIYRTNPLDKKIQQDEINKILN